MLKVCGLPKSISINGEAPEVERTVSGKNYMVFLLVLFLTRGRALVPRGTTRVQTVQLLYNRPFYEAFLLKGMFISHSSV